MLYTGPNCKVVEPRSAILCSRLVINSRSSNHSEMINTIWAHVLPSSLFTICITCLCTNREYLRDWMPWRRHIAHTAVVSFAHGKHQCQEITDLRKCSCLWLFTQSEAPRTWADFTNFLTPQQTNRQLEAICKQKILNAVEKSRHEQEIRWAHGTLSWECQSCIDYSCTELLQARPPRWP
jgi:hypothetical protein